MSKTYFGQVSLDQFCQRPDALEQVRVILQHELVKSRVSVLITE